MDASVFASNAFARSMCRAAAARTVDPFVAHPLGLVAHDFARKGKPASIVVIQFEAAWAAAYFEFV
jgi:hypothetical protein